MKSGNSTSNGDLVPCDYHKQSIINQIVGGIADEEAPESENDYIDDDLLLHGDFFDDLEHISSPFTLWLTQIVE